MKHSVKKLLAMLLCLAMVVSFVPYAAVPAAAVDYMDTLPQQHYGDYLTLSMIYDYGSCYSMQGMTADATYTYCAKIGSNDAVAVIVRTHKTTGAKDYMINSANGGYYFYNLGHANALDITNLNGSDQMFVTAGATLVRLTMKGTTLTTAGTYTASLNGAKASMTAVQLMTVSPTEVKVLVKSGRTIYTGTLDPTASSGDIALTKLCTLDVTNVRLKGEMIDYSTFTQQGFDYHDGKLFLPLTGNAYAETINYSVVLVYDLEGANGTVRNDPSLSFRVISGTYAGLFEIEDVVVCNETGRLYFTTNRRKTASDTDYDSCSYFYGYTYDPAMNTFTPADYRWETVNNQWVSVIDGGNTYNAPTPAYGSISDNTMSLGIYSLSRSVMLKHDVPWVMEWKSSGTFGGGGMMLASGKTSYVPNKPYLFRYKESRFIAFGYYTGSQHNNYGVNLADHGIDGTAEHVYRLTNKIASDGSNMIYLSVDGKELGAMNNYYIGTSKQNTTSDWVSGRDFTFSYQGTFGNPLNNCKLDYLQIWADGEPEDVADNYRWETKSDAFTTVTGSGYTQNTPYMYNGTISGGVYSGACFRLTEPVVLLHDRSWSIQWQSEGSIGGGTFLLSAAEGTKTDNAPFVFRYGDSGLLAIGYFDGKNHNNFGLTLSDYGIDSTLLHTYRLSNKVASDGSNMVWLSVDGKEIAPLNGYYLGISNQNTTNDWLNGKDLVFDYVGNRGYTVNGTYHYLQVNEGCSHSYTSKVTTAATCNTAGVRTYTCSGCGDTYTESIPTTAHSYTSKVTAPTCTTKGYTTYTCSKCGYSYTANEVAATGHSYTSRVTTTAGCTTTGVRTYTCSKCGGSYTETLPATGHSYTTKVTAPSCTAQGYTTYTCSKCGYSYTGNQVAATGHSYSGGSCTVCGAADPNHTVATTYYLVGYINGADYGCEGDYENMGQYKFENGKLVATFSSDSYVFIKTEGNERWYLTPSYCTATTGTFVEGGVEKMYVPGNVEITFTLTENADGSLTLSYTAAQQECDHAYTSQVTTAATCIAPGVRTYTCSKCGAFFKQTIAATGHSYSGGSCTTCGAKDPVVSGETYYLFGYINGANYACEEDYENMGQYKFVNGKLTVTFERDSYVGVKTEGNQKWFMTDGWQGMDKTYITLYETGTLFAADKFFVPGNVQVTFSLIENVDGTLTLSYSTAETEASVVPTLTLKYPTVSFEDVIVMNVYYTAENMEDVVEMGLITYTGSVSEWNVYNAEGVVPGYSYASDKQMYVSSTKGIAGKNLGDTLYFAVYAKLADGTYTYTKLVSYSPETYAYSQLSTGTAEVKALVVAMLKYGAAAQNFFGHNTGSLVDRNLTSAQLGLIESYRADMMASVAAPSTAKQGAFVATGGHVNRYPTVSFEGAFSINYYYTPSYQPVDGITMYYWNQADYNAVQVLSAANATGAIRMAGSGTSRYSAAVEDIAAKDLDQGVYVAFVYSDGTNSYASGVLAYSIGDYCTSSAGSSAAVSDLAAATAVYGYYAKKTFY